MIEYVRGNLLEADVEALVNTVNTVGVMGKGIALMFKEAYPENYRAYRAACKRGEVEIGRMFVTERSVVVGPKWIINFPTKQHWRGKTRLEWLASGLDDLQRVIERLRIRTIAVPPVGCGHGGLDWNVVRPMIESSLGSLPNVTVLAYEPTYEYQNVAKRTGVEKLTPARALVAEMVRRYWVLGIECTMLEVQKLSWFLEREINREGLENPLDLQFSADRYGPYADRLRHLLERLDGSYLRSEVRVPDAKPTDVIAFNDGKREAVATYIRTEASVYEPALERVTKLIDGFESPLGLELLATVDWLMNRAGRRLDVGEVRDALAKWPGGKAARARKLRLLDERLIELALQRLLAPVEPLPAS